MYTDITYLEKREREDNRSNSDKIKTKDVILKAVPRSIRLCSNSTSLVRPYSTRCKWGQGNGRRKSVFVRFWFWFCLLLSPTCLCYFGSQSLYFDFVFSFLLRVSVSLVRTLCILILSSFFYVSLLVWFTVVFDWDTVSVMRRAVRTHSEWIGNVPTDTFAEFFFSFFTF